MNCFIKSCPIQIIVDSRGDRYLSHSSRHTQAPVPATISEKSMKNTEGVPRGRGLAAPESVCLLSISFR